MRFKKPQNTHVFPIQHDDSLETINQGSEQLFFNRVYDPTKEDALSNNVHIGSSISKQRFVFIGWICAVIFFILAGKVSALQLLNGDTYREQAERNRFNEIVIPANRGIIYDRDGLELAKNTPTYHLTLTPYYLPEENTETYVRELLERYELHPDPILKILPEKEGSKEPLFIEEPLTHELALKFISESSDHPALQIEIGSERNYLTYAIPSLSHVLGYTGIVSPEEYEIVKEDGYRRFDQIGKQGLESEYETRLRGAFGHELVEVDALGREERFISKQDPVDGENLTLSIDASFQTYIEEVLEARLEGTPATKASVILMDPNNGEVLSLVSWPAYDANIFTGRVDVETYRQLIEDERLPLFPRATSGEFPSGSTIKPVFAAAGLIEGIITPSTTVVSTGGISVGPWFFPDWRPGGHGVTNVYHAIADSVNTFFYILGGGYQDTKGLGIEKLMEYAALFGFGEKTGIDLPVESDGFLPSMQWKEETKGERWYIGDTYNTSIGQGDFLASPLQIARATAVFANGGNLVTPHLVMGEGDAGVRIIDSDIATVIKDAMRETVTNGSATSLQLVPVAVAGKTGTAQWSSTRPNHSWFTGFAPFDDPELVITVLIEKGGDTSIAIPVTRDILTRWFANSP